MGRWWRWALVSPDLVAPSRMVSVPASVNLPLHHEVQKFSSGTGSSGWSWKKGRKTVVVWWWCFNSDRWTSGEGVCFLVSRTGLAAFKCYLRDFGIIGCTCVISNSGGKCWPHLSIAGKLARLFVQVCNMRPVLGVNSGKKSSYQA